MMHYNPDQGFMTEAWSAHRDYLWIMKNFGFMNRMGQALYRLKRKRINGRTVGHIRFFKIKQFSNEYPQIQKEILHRI